MGETEELEYDENMISLLEAVWGEGFMSPGGTDEVDRVLGNKDLSQARVLDIGCGIGGAAVHIALTRQPSSVTGIDIEENLVNLYKQNITLYLVLFHDSLKNNCKKSLY